MMDPSSSSLRDATSPQGEAYLSSQSHSLHNPSVCSQLPSASLRSAPYLKGRHKECSLLTSTSNSSKLKLSSWKLQLNFALGWFTCGQLNKQYILQIHLICRSLSKAIYMVHSKSSTYWRFLIVSVLLFFVFLRLDNCLCIFYCICAKMKGEILCKTWQKNLRIWQSKATLSSRR